MRKQYILYIVTIISILLPIYTNNVFALSYESNIGIGFTFNPSLSLSISSSSLVIDNLTPGTIADSNDITISVATNASYGYTLSANTNSESLVHSNNTNTFNGIATNANLEVLTTDNTWSYSTSLDNGSSWSNYNGLSSSSSTTLLDTNTNSDGNSDGNNSGNNNIENNGVDSIDFKIAAKASSTQSSGIYTNTITFYATTKPTPITLAEAYASENKTMINGFYTIQDMTSAICNKTEAIGAQLQVLDIRDNKLYWIAKLADNHCWMTQNLDLDLDSNKTYTHWDTDLGWSTENGNTIDENATWKPSSSTINFNGATTNQVVGWVNSNIEPYSANPGDIYYYTSNTDANDIQYNSLQECENAEHNDCTHYHAGNYYNWSAAVASNDTSNITSNNVSNSICPKNWRLPKHSNNEFSYLFYSQQIKESIGGTNDYLFNGFNKIRTTPPYFIRSGYILDRVLRGLDFGEYWTNRTVNIGSAFNLGFSYSTINSTTYHSDRGRGYSIRCLAR